MLTYRLSYSFFRILKSNTNCGWPRERSSPTHFFTASFEFWNQKQILVGPGNCHTPLNYSSSFFRILESNTNFGWLRELSSPTYFSSSFFRILESNTNFGWPRELSSPTYFSYSFFRILKSNTNFGWPRELSSLTYLRGKQPVWLSFSVANIKGTQFLKEHWHEIQFWTLANNKRNPCFYINHSLKATVWRLEAFRMLPCLHGRWSEIIINSFTYEFLIVHGVF